MRLHAGDEVPHSGTTSLRPIGRRDPWTGFLSGVFDLASVVTGLDRPPAADLDPFLDAAARCFARHGLRRTSVQDVARELQRLVISIPDRAPQPVGPVGVIEIMASVIDDVRAHPVVAKVLADDTDTITLSTLGDLPLLLERVAAGLTPMLSLAMDAGSLARRDPVILAEWLIRLVVTLVLLPPLTDLRPFLSELLLPALIP